MKKVIAILLALVLMFALVACQGADEEDDRIRLVYIINGTLGDKSFFDSGKEGVDMINEAYGDKVVAEYRELTYDRTKWETGTADVVADGWDIVIAGTWDMMGYIQTLAGEYPDTDFWFFDESWDFENYNYDNVYCMPFMQNEGSYLVGMAAAMTTQTGKIGFVGGMSNTVLKDFVVGYVEGARSVNPDIEISVSWSDTFNDATINKTIATGLYEAGYDVIFSCSGSAGLGVFDAAIEKEGCYVIGVDGDQGAFFAASGDTAKAERTITSMEKRVKNGFFNAMTRHLEGTLPYGTNEQLGLAVECVAASASTILTAEQMAEIEAAAAKIISGEIKVGTSFGMDEALYNSTYEGK